MRLVYFGIPGSPFHLFAGSHCLQICFCASLSHRSIPHIWSITFTDKCLSNLRQDASYLVAKFKICVFEYIKKGDVNKSRTWWQYVKVSASYQILYLHMPSAFEQLY